MCADIEVRQRGRSQSPRRRYCKKAFRARNAASGGNKRAGNRKGFAINPDGTGLATYQLPDPGAYGAGPINPVSMPRGKADATIVLTATISDPDGLADIKSTTADELLGGVWKDVDVDVPVQFYSAPLDNGAAPDTTAGDGIFSTLGRLAARSTRSTR
jgi:hypothetical protein